MAAELPILNGPIPFIETVGGAMQVNKETARQLSQLDKPLAVVAIAGPYRTGKSFLLNQLIGQSKG